MNKRDWQADMTECRMWKTRTTSSLPSIGIHWLQQYAAEKQRADIAELAYQGLAENAVNRGEYQSLLDKHTAMTKAYRVEKERADQAEAREQKLKEALERILKTTKEEAASKYYTNTIILRKAIILRQKVIENLFSALYPKEETE